jgi:hypothetical protein
LFSITLFDAQYLWLTSLRFTGCLQELVWETVALMNKQMYTEIPIVFEEVRFHRATNIPKQGKYCGAVVRSFMIAVNWWVA